MNVYIIFRLQSVELIGYNEEAYHSVGFYVKINSWYTAHIQHTSW